MSLSDTAVRLATLVPERRRQTFLPTMFGTRHLIIAENTLYNLMGWLSPQDYGGGLWDFYEQEGMPLYLVPTSRPRYRIVCETNGYEGEVPAEAAGIIATLFTLSHLSFSFESDHFAEGYQRLRAYSDGHPESSVIFAAID